ncbi:tetratricopeptide repeat protein [Streptomyces sp. NBC_00335]|uniref:tetratricopeptide repeat protein n=1 Tax=unclassified Streptomyces TaxID=2593676 RepID=UPI0022521662|nr:MULTISPECIES: tetratricopeptide repeat protein [unclassified Streptomyces]MCX5403123.1 tetratricopeptide repeat protein [Streptomyces sp. NBC_00086]
MSSARDVTGAIDAQQGYLEHGTTAERWDRGRLFFEAKEYANAARVLHGVAAEAPELLAPRLLLARAYYHSAQLSKAEGELRGVLDRWPVEDYAQLMLGRTLERQGRAAEAAAYLRIAAAMAGDFPE